MNEITDKPVDRFHKKTETDPQNPWSGGCGLLGQMTGEERRDFEAKTETGFKEPKAIGAMEFAPEPLHMTESKVRNMKFTVGKRYSVLERREGNDYSDRMSEMFPGSYASHYTFKTKDDNDQEVWIDEKYFIPAHINLMHEKSCGWAAISDDGLKVSDDGIEEAVDIRTLAKEKNIPDLDVDMNEDLQTLSGLKESELRVGGRGILSLYDGTPYHSHTSGDSYKSAWRAWSTKRKLFEKPSSIYEGIVQDDGNELMNDATKCMAAVDKVFGYNKVVDPDGIIEAISRVVPHLHLGWEDHILTVNGAKTKITYSEVQGAYSGLKGLVSAKVAERTVGKLVAGMLKKVF